MRSTGLILAAFLLTATSAASAQNLLEIYQSAKLADPAWLGTIASNKAAQEATQQSFANFLPDASLSAASTSNFSDSNFFSTTITDRREKYNSNNWTLSITQPVFQMSSYATHRQAKANVRQSDAQLAAQAQDLIIRVTQAYFDTLSAEIELTSVQAEKKAISRQLDQAQKRFEVGLIAITDVHEAQASYDLTLAQELAAENQLLLARDVLSEITGEKSTALTHLKEKIELVSPEPANIDEWVNMAIENNLSITAAKAAFEAAQENVHVKRAGHYPTLNLVATAGNSTSHAGVTGSDTDSSSIGLQFKLPIYSGGAVSSQTRQALALLEQSQQELTRTRRSTERQTRSAYLGTMTAISRIKALQQAVVSTQSAVDATEAGFEVGTRTIVDVLNAQRGLYRSIADYQQARNTYIMNGLKLKQAAGTLSDVDVASINNLLIQH